MRTGLKCFPLFCRVSRVPLCSKPTSPCSLHTICSSPSPQRDPLCPLQQLPLLLQLCFPLQGKFLHLSNLSLLSLRPHVKHHLPFPDAKAMSDLLGTYSNSSLHLLAVLTRLLSKSVISKCLSVSRRYRLYDVPSWIYQNPDALKSYCNGSQPTADGISQFKPN